MARSNRKINHFLFLSFIRTVMVIFAIIWTFLVVIFLFGNFIYPFNCETFFGWQWYTFSACSLVVSLGCGYYGYKILRFIFAFVFFDILSILFNFFNILGQLNRFKSKFFPIKATTVSWNHTSLNIRQVLRNRRK